MNKKNSIKTLSKFLKLIGAGIISFIFLLSILFTFLYFSDDIEEDYVNEEMIENSEEDECNVVGIQLHGDLFSYISNEDTDADGLLLYDLSSSEDVVYTINTANEDENIKAILIEVESNGGLPTAAEEIEAAIEHSEKPVVVYVRASALSAAYWAVSGADYIIALPSSDVGSIGVTISYIDNVQQNAKEGLRFNKLSTGKFKDMLNGDKPLTFEEKQLVMRDLNIINENFIKTISENRNIDINKVRNLADGSSMVSWMALENKLIDDIGSIYKVEEYIKKLIEDDLEICW